MQEPFRRADVLQRVANQIQGDQPILPGLPQVLLRVRDAIDDSDISARELADVILEDPSLTASVLRLANSAYYRQTRAKVRTITSAIILLGFETVRNLVLGLSVYNMLSTLPKVKNYRHLWRHSLCCGVCAQRLAEHGGMAVPEEAFVAGLLHDTGKFVLGQTFPQAYAEVLNTVNGTGVPFMEAELRILKVEHMEIGRLTAEAWSFPPEVVEAICRHELGPEEDLANEAMLPLRRIVILANKIAHAVYQRDEPGQSMIAQHELLSLTTDVMQIDAEVVGEIVGTLKEEVRRTASVMDIVIDDWRFASGVYPKAGPDAGEESGCDPATAAERLDFVLYSHQQSSDATNLIEFLKATAPKLRDVLALRHVFLLGLAPEEQALVGTFAYGRGVDSVRERIHVTLEGSDDVAARAFIQRHSVVASADNQDLFARPGAENTLALLDTRNAAAVPVMQGETVGAVLLVTRTTDAPPINADESGILDLYARDLAAPLTAGASHIPSGKPPKDPARDSAQRRRATTRIIRKADLS